MVAGERDLELFRSEISRILASPEFASSRQLQDFLRYTSEKAFGGESQLDQNEIASAVLRRGANFNPVEDATVRKVASQVRQRLEHYYSQPGRSGDVLVTLPVRCYVPKFEKRRRGDSEPPPVSTRPLQKELWVRVVCAAVVIAAALALWAAFRGNPAAPPSDTTAGEFELWTAKGDIYTGVNDAPGSSVRLGPELRQVDEVTARLDFTPNREAQQAGLIVWQDGSHFIRLGRKFFGRNQIEFLLEEGKASFSTPANTVYDPEGQSGQPIWLSIRRMGNSYRAFLSPDGIRWQPHGEPIVPRQPFPNPRAGIYALNGRRDAPSIRAAFHGLATGWTFDGSAFPPASAGDWNIANTCPATTTAALDGPALRIAIATAGGNCGYEISRPLSGEDWEISTRIDSFPLPGHSAGLRVQGTKAVVRVVRYFLNGPAISFINDSRTLIGKPDLNGSPAVFLRLAARHGILAAGYSADGERFEPLPVSMKVAELGGNLRAGIRFSTSAAGQEEPSSVARFYYFRESIRALIPYR